MPPSPNATMSSNQQQINFEASCGTEILRETSRIRIPWRKRVWLAIGEVMDKFDNEVMPEIEALLHNEDPGYAEYYFSVVMVGKRPATAKPKILVSCTNSDVRTEVLRIIKSSHHIRDMYPEFGFGESSVPLHEPMPSVPLAGRVGSRSRTTSQDNVPALVDMPSRKEPRKSLKTNTVLASDNDPSIGRKLFLPTADDEPTRFATGGVVVRIDDKYYQKTVGHIDELQLDPTEQWPPDDIEYCRFDDDSDDEDDEMFENDCDITSRGSMTPEDNLSQAGSFDDSDTTSFGVTAGPSSLDDGWRYSRSESGETASFVHQSSRSDESVRIPLGMNHVGELQHKSRAGKKPALDYAFVRLDDGFDPETANKICVDPTTNTHIHIKGVEPIAAVERDIVTVTASGGLARGKLMPSAVYFRSPNQKSFQKLYVVRLSTMVVDGDCGADVVDANTGNLYGHIVRGCRSTQIAYIVPAQDVFEDMKERISIQPEIASSQIEDRIGHDAGGHRKDILPYSALQGNTDARYDFEHDATHRISFPAHENAPVLLLSWHPDADDEDEEALDLTRIFRMNSIFESPPTRLRLADLNQDASESGVLWLIGLSGSGKSDLLGTHTGGRRRSMRKFQAQKRQSRSMISLPRNREPYTPVWLQSESLKTEGRLPEVFLDFIVGNLESQQRQPDDGISPGNLTAALLQTLERLGKDTIAAFDDPDENIYDTNRPGDSTSSSHQRILEVPSRFVGPPATVLDRNPAWSLAVHNRSLSELWGRLCPQILQYTISGLEIRPDSDHIAIWLALSSMKRHNSTRGTIRPPNATDSYALTSLHLATEEGNSEMLRKTIVEVRQGLNDYDPGCRTPIHLAISKSDIEIMKLLLGYSALSASESIATADCHAEQNDTELDEFPRSTGTINGSSGLLATRSWLLENARTLGMRILSTRQPRGSKMETHVVVLGSSHPESSVDAYELHQSSSPDPQDNLYPVCSTPPPFVCSVVSSQDLHTQPHEINLLDLGLDIRPLGASFLGKLGELSPESLQPINPPKLRGLHEIKCQPKPCEGNSGTALSTCSSNHSV